MNIIKKVNNNNKLSYENLIKNHSLILKQEQPSIFFKLIKIEDEFHDYLAYSNKKDEKLDFNDNSENKTILFTSDSYRKTKFNLKKNINKNIFLLYNESYKKNLNLKKNEKFLSRIFLRRKKNKRKLILINLGLIFILKLKNKYNFYKKKVKKKKNLKILAIFQKQKNKKNATI